MRYRSYRKWLLRSFLVAGIAPLLVCVVLILGTFQTSVERYADSAGQNRLSAMSRAMADFMTQCADTLQRVAEDPLIAQAAESGAQRDTSVYSVLYQAVNTIKPEAGLSVYDADGRLLYTTADGEPGEALPVNWGLLSAARERAGTVYRRVSPYDAVTRDCLQIVRPIRSGGDTVGYAVVEVTEKQLAALFESWNGDGEYLLLDPFWEEVCASPALRGLDAAASLRGAMLNGTQPEVFGASVKLLFSREARSGFCLVLAQKQPLIGRTQQFLYSVALFSILVCLALCIWFSIRLSKRVSEPVRSLNDAMGRVELGDLDVQLPVDGVDELSQLSERFNVMTRQLKQNIGDSLRQQQELSDIRMRMMQAQLNPHFLYNTLDTVKWLGKIHQVQDVSTIAADLAAILRRSISADRFVTLESALEVLDRYVEIQKIRFPGKFEYRSETQPEALERMIPKLMLQPLVENAIIHGFEDGSMGEIVVSARLDAGALVLEVRDKGCGMSEESKQRFLEARKPGFVPGNHHLGLYNVDAILRLRYGQEHGLQLVETERGTCIRAVLPPRGTEREEAEV